MTEINYSDLFIKAFDDFEAKLKKEEEEEVKESLKEDRPLPPAPKSPKSLGEE